MPGRVPSQGYGGSGGTSPLSEAVRLATRGSNRARLVLPCEAASSGAARRFVLAALLEWEHHGVADQATLVVSELVTNAVLHARTEVEVIVERRGAGVRLEVGDGSQVQPHVKDYGPDGSTGRGLQLVDGMAAAWGVLPSTRGKVVWVDLDPDPRYDDVDSIVAGGGSGSSR